MKKQFIKRIAKIILTFALFFFTPSIGLALTYYVDSTKGNDANPGTLSSPFANVKKALQYSKAGDFIRLMPGIYKGVITITRSGELDNPITITSHSENQDQFAVIDSGASASDSNKYGFKLKNCKWINIENLKFRNCWKEIIEVENSSYITIRGNDFREGRRVIYPYGTGSHHLLIENNYWEQDRRIWTTWNWASLHDKYIYNGAFYGTIQGEQGPGASVIRNNHLKYVFNGIWMRSAALNRQANNEIYGNLMEYVRDNAIEPEDRTFNLHIYHNVLNQVSNGIFSIQGVAGGPIYIYGNTGYYNPDDPPRQDEDPYGKASWRIFKMSNSGDSKLDDILHIYHNTWYYGCLTYESHKSNRHIRHYNNIGIFKDGYKLTNYQFDSWDNDFDYDYSDKTWPSSIAKNNKERNGISNTLLRNANSLSKGEFRVDNDSHLIDKGKIITGFTQSYQGSAPDLGAFENNRLVEGPPFFIKVPPGGLGFVERPRITRHRINNNQLSIFWSWPINPETISKDTIVLKANNSRVDLAELQMDNNNIEVIITSNVSLKDKKISLEFIENPVGSNGQKATLWANTLSERRLTNHTYDLTPENDDKLFPPQNLKITTK